MLKRKLQNQAKTKENKTLKNDSVDESRTSSLFAKPFWQKFYEIELDLNEKLSKMTKPPAIQYIYNPVEYAKEVHCEYLKKYLNSCKKVLFVGMNPGANGMGQTGVPFGNITTVRDIMQLSGLVEKPHDTHPKRPVNGLQHTTEEPSGKRLWPLLEKLAGGSLDTFFKQCFVHNFCPLMYFDKHGKNITPSELKGDYKQEILHVCLETLESLIQLVNCEIVVAVGDYVFQCLKKSENCQNKRIMKLPHPSPRAVGNQNWPDKADKWFRNEQLLPYIRGEL
uniref:Single-strand selective monofunctional uracil DNA glycosylase n=1 Tax=Glossina morsitans morsitans TaxID=37546 RepID=D3TS52_GLOMM